MIDRIQRYKWWLLAVILLGGWAWFYERWRTYREDSQDASILAAGARYGVDPALIKAVVWRESWFNPKAKGTRGELGLMQIREPTAKDWAAAERIHLFTHFQLLDPGRNTECGAWYLRRLLQRYQGSDNPLPFALAAYNAGPANVARWRKGPGTTNSVEFLNQMDYPATRSYVATVMKRYAHYRKTFATKKPT